MANILKSFNRITTLDSGDNVLLSGPQEIKFDGNLSVSVVGNKLTVTGGAGAAIPVTDGVLSFNATQLNFFGEVNLTDNGGVADIEILGSVNTIQQNSVVIANNINNFNFIGATVNDDGGGQASITILPNAPSGNANTFAYFNGAGDLVGTINEVSYVYTDSVSPISFSNAVFLLKVNSDVTDPVINGNGNRVIGVASDSSFQNSSSLIACLNNSSVIGAIGSIIAGNNLEVSNVTSSLICGNGIELPSATVQRSVICGSGNNNAVSGTINNSVVVDVGSGGLTETNINIQNSFRAGQFSGDNFTIQRSVLTSGAVNFNNFTMQESLALFSPTLAKAFTGNVVQSVIIYGGTQSFDFQNLQQSIIITNNLSLNASAQLKNSIIMTNSSTVDTDNTNNAMFIVGNNMDNTTANDDNYNFLLGEDLVLNNVNSYGKIGNSLSHIHFKSYSSPNTSNIKIKGYYGFEAGLHALPNNNISSTETVVRLPNASDINTIDNPDNEEALIKTLVCEGAAATIRHNTGNLLLNGSVDASLTQGSTISFVYNNSLNSWLETARSIV